MIPSLLVLLLVLVFVPVPAPLAFGTTVNNRQPWVKRLLPQRGQKRAQQPRGAGACVRRFDSVKDGGHHNIRPVGVCVCVCVCSVQRTHSAGGVGCGELEFSFSVVPTHRIEFGFVGVGVGVEGVVAEEMAGVQRRCWY